MKKSTFLRILLVDDHPVVRAGLASLIRLEKGMQVAGTASSGHGAVTSFLSLRPDLTLLDLRLPGLDGIQALTAIRRHDPSARVVILTAFADEEDVYRALAAGAQGYLMKNCTQEELIACIGAVKEGKTWVPADIAAKLASRVSRHELSPREREVLALVAVGKTNKEIAFALRITEGTVKVHVDHILKKLNARGRTEAAALAFQLGLIRVQL